MIKKRFWSGIMEFIKEMKFMFFTNTTGLIAQSLSCTFTVAAKSLNAPLKKCVLRTFQRLASTSREELRSVFCLTACVEQSRKVVARWWAGLTFLPEEQTLFTRSKASWTSTSTTRLWCHMLRKTCHFVGGSGRTTTSSTTNNLPRVLEDGLRKIWFACSPGHHNCQISTSIKTSKQKWCWRKPWLLSPSRDVPN